MTELEDEEYEEDEGQEILPESLKVTEHLKATQAEVDESLSQDDDIKIVIPEKLIKNKKMIIISMLAIAMCFLVMGMTVKYNNLVKAYNEVADEANKCRSDHVWIYGVNSSLVGSYPILVDGDNVSS